MGSAEDQPRRSRIRLPPIPLPREPASRRIAVPRAVRGAAFQARGVVGPPNGIGGTRRVVHSDNLSGRVFSAWVTSAPSTVVTLLVQVIAMPIVYRSLGPGQFAAFAAVTAVVSILNFLNLGMGGALVTSLAEEAAVKDRDREASLLRYAVFPLTALSIAGLVLALPVLSLLPLRTLFGLAATGTPGPALRAAAVIACIGTIIAIPLSVVESVRQAYQELHVNNFLNALCNGFL